MRHITVVAVIAVSLAVSSCRPPGGLGTPTAARIGLKVTNNQVMSSAVSRSMIGQTDASGLLSYQVAITKIQLITDATITGTGWSDPVQSLTLYENPVAIDDASAANESTGGFVDLLDSSALDAFSPRYTLTTADAGVYQYLFISYAPYVRFKAQVAMDNAGTTRLYSKSGGTFVYSTTASPVVPSTGMGWFTDDSGADFSTGPAELATVKIGSGGSIMKFAKPLTITEDDLAKGIQLKLMLVFDPVGAITAATKSTSVNQLGQPADFVGGSFFDGNLSGFDVPIPTMGALVSAEGQTVVMETYTTAIHETKSDGSDRSTNSSAWNSQWFRQRIEIFSLAEDPATILSVQVTNLIETASKASTTSSSWAPPPPAPSPLYFTTSADGKLSMQDYNHQDIVGGLQRLTSVGQTGTADFTYSSSMAPDPAVAAPYSSFQPKTETLGYTLEAIRTVAN